MHRRFHLDARTLKAPYAFRLISRLMQGSILSVFLMNFPVRGYLRKLPEGRKKDGDKKHLTAENAESAEKNEDY
jgi:hypothetical protein